MSKNMLWLSCATGALVLGAGAAHAATATANAAAAANETSSVSELVVVAEHREQSLQKVPVAVSVFTGAQRDIAGINSVQDVTNFAPGFTYDPGNVHAYIRGVGRQSINVTNDSRVASYEDEFYVYSPYQLDKSSLFLTQEQIERGPQSVGGKEAIGGSIDMISVRPTDHPYAEVRAAVGNFGTYNIEGAVSGPVTDTLNVRFAAYDHNQDDGFYKNLVNGISEGNEIHEWYVEGQFDWKPNDKAELWGRAFLADWNNRGDAGARNGYVKGSWDETNLTDANSYPGGALFVNPNFGYESLVPSAAAANANFVTAGPLKGLAYTPVATTLLRPGILNNPATTNPNEFAAILDRYNTLNNYDGIQLNFTYDITPGIQFRYITGYQQYNYTLNYSEPDTDVTSFTMGLPAFGGVGTVTGAPALVINPLVDLTYIEDDGWWSHEVSLQSIDDKPLQWTAGLYYFQQHYINPIWADAPQQPQFAHPIQLFPFLGGHTVPAAANPQQYLFYQNYQFTYRDEAAYGQVSYKLNDQWKLVGNLRYTNDNKSGVEEARFVSFANSFIDALGPYFGAGTPAVDVTGAVACPTGTGVAGSASCLGLVPTKLGTGVVAAATTNAATGIMSRPLAGDSDAVTGGAGVEFTPTNDIFMYARYSRGYEAMSFNAGYISSNPETKPEFLNSYELGYKETFGSKLLIDLAVFYYDYNQMQVPLTVSNGGVTQASFINVPKAVSTGVEFEGDWSPIKPLTISLSYSYDYTSIRTGCSGSVSPSGSFIASPSSLCVLDVMDPAAVAPGANPVAGGGGLQSVKGNPLPNAPRNKVGVTAAYTWNFEPGSFTLAGAYVWRDTQDGTLFNRFYDNAPSWDDVDLRGTWKGPNDRYEIIGYVKNVFNTLQYEVGNEGQGLLGSNRNSTTAAAGLDYANVYTLAPPRTYGLEVRYKFF